MQPAQQVTLNLDLKLSATLEEIFELRKQK
jgi:hypothetical protein